VGDDVPQSGWSEGGVGITNSVFGSIRVALRVFRKAKVVAPSALRELILASEWFSGSVGEADRVRKVWVPP